MMPEIIFYEKPGCLTNRKQKALLRAVGFSLEVRDLLSYPWTVKTLKQFLQYLPVTEWFNRAAPQLKSGEIAPETLDEETALSMLIEQPLLIRRPLLQWQDNFRAGFDLDRLQQELGIQWPGVDTQTEQSLDQCSRIGSKTEVCP